MQNLIQKERNQWLQTKEDLRQRRANLIRRSINENGLALEVTMKDVQTLNEQIEACNEIIAYLNPDRQIGLF